MFRSFFGKTKEPSGSTEEEAILQELRRGGAIADRVVLTRNRRIMASLADKGRTIRLHEAFRSAPTPVLSAVGVLFSARSKTRRARAKADIRSFLDATLPQIVAGGAPSPRRRVSRPRTGDLPHIERLRQEFDRINIDFFGGRLPRVPLRISGRMRRRNGQFCTDPLEIAISRTLCHQAADGEAENTLRHEMIHLWQWMEGRKPGHGADFRRWARRLEIHPRASRTVCWVDPAE